MAARCFEYGICNHQLALQPMSTLDNRILHILTLSNLHRGCCWSTQAVIVGNVQGTTLQAFDFYIRELVFCAVWAHSVIRSFVGLVATCSNSIASHTAPFMPTLRAWPAINTEALPRHFCDKPQTHVQLPYSGCTAYDPRLCCLLRSTCL